MCILAVLAEAFSVIAGHRDDGGELEAAELKSAEQSAAGDRETEIR